MIEFEDKSYFVGDELIRILIEAYHVCFEFQNTTLHLGSKFAVWHFDQKVADISPTERVGEVGTLWSAVGAKVVRVVWNSVVSLEFDNGTKVVVLETDQTFRGTILSRDGLLVEDF